MLNNSPHYYGNENRNQTSESLVSRGLTGVRYLVGLQLFSRIVTFAMNQFIMRSINADTLGVVEIQLELLLSTILFLSREGFRTALLRAKDPITIAPSKGDKHLSKKSPHRLSESDQTVFNLALLPAALGIPVSLLVCIIYYILTPAKTYQISYFSTSVVLYGMAATLELLIEPLFILSQVKMRFKLRAQSEGLAIFTRCFVTLAGVKWGNFILTGSQSDLVLLWFSLARLISGGVLFLYYIGFYIFTEGWAGFKSSFRIRKIKQTRHVDTNILFPFALYPK